MIQVESFNMREGTSLGKPRNVFNRRTRTCADNNPFPPKDACAAISKRDLNGFGSDEASRPHKQFRPARLEICEVHVHQSVNHLPLAITHTRHVDLAIVLGDSEFSTSPKVRGHLRAMDDIFARQTGDVGAGASDIFSLNDDRSHSLFSQGPGDVLACFAAAQHGDIVLFEVWSGCLHRFTYLGTKKALTISTSDK